MFTLRPGPRFYSSSLMRSMFITSDLLTHQLIGVDSVVGEAAFFGELDRTVLRSHRPTVLTGPRLAPAPSSLPAPACRAGSRACEGCASPIRAAGRGRCRAA